MIASGRDFSIIGKAASIPEIGGSETTVFMHNDAVVQGLSEAPFMHDVETWATFTIGTGLGNALYSNRKD